MEPKDDITPENIRQWLSDDDDSDGGREPSADEVTLTEQALIAFAQAQALEPAPEMRERILSNLHRLIRQQQEAEPIDLSRPPLLTADANLQSWINAVAHIQPPPDFENIHLHPLRSDETAELFVAFVHEFIPEEVHHDVLESFMLLEGSCECIITDQGGQTRTVHMREGDFMAFALGEVHEIYITSSERPAKAILQWLKTAA